MRYFITTILIAFELILNAQTWTPIYSNQKIDGVWANKYLRFPTDTTANKTGVALVANKFWIGNGTKWSTVASDTGRAATQLLTGGSFKKALDSAQNLNVRLAGTQIITGAKSFTAPVEINSGASISLLTSGNINITSLGDSYLYLNNTTATTGRNWQIGSLSNGDFTISNFTASTVPLTIKASGASVFSSSVSIGGTTAGRVNIINGNSSNTGFIEWIKSDGTTRQAYFGYDNSNLTLFVESGQFKINGVTNISTRLNVAGATDNPSYEFNVNGNAKVSTINTNSVFIGDIVLDGTQLYRNSSSPLYLNYLGTGQTLIGNSAGITLYGPLTSSDIYIGASSRIYSNSISGGSNGWNFGGVFSPGGLSLNTSTYLTVNINGTTYKLATVN